MKLSNPNTVTRTKSRETVHNSSWRPPGISKRSLNFQVARSRPQQAKLLWRSLTSYILWQLLAGIPNIVICESLEEGTLFEINKSLNDSPLQSDFSQPLLEEGDRRLETIENPMRPGRNLWDDRQTSRHTSKAQTVRWVRSRADRPQIRQPVRVDQLATRVKVPANAKLEPAAISTHSILFPPFGRKLSQESQNFYRKAITEDVIKPSNIRKRNFSASISQVVSSTSTEEHSSKINSQPKFQRLDDKNKDVKESKIEISNVDIKEDKTRGSLTRGEGNDRTRSGVKRPSWNSTVSFVRGSNARKPVASSDEYEETLPKRGRVRMDRSKLRLYRRRQTTTKPPNTHDDNVPLRPSKRDRIRNLKIRRPIKTNLNVSSNPITHTGQIINLTSSQPTLSSTAKPTSIPLNLIMHTSTTRDNQEMVSRRNTSPTTTETIVNLKGLVKEYQEIVRTSPPPTLATNSKTLEVEKSTDQSGPPISSKPKNKPTTPMTSTEKTLTTIQAQTPIVQFDMNTTAQPEIPLKAETSTTTEKYSIIKPEKLLKVKTPSTTEKSKFEGKKAPTTSTESFFINDFEEKTIKKRYFSESKNDEKALNNSGSTINTLVGKSRIPSTSIRPNADNLKDDLLEAIRRKISRNKVANSVSQKSELVAGFDISTSHAAEPKKFNYYGADSRNPASNFVSSTSKPSFFRPISFPPKKLKKNESIYGNQSPNVKIFVNIPDTKPGSVVKIPNVSHIQDKLARLNAAITEGLRLQRQREREEEEIRKDWEDKNDSADELSLPLAKDTSSSSFGSPSNFSTLAVSNTSVPLKKENIASKYASSTSTVLSKVVISQSSGPNKTTSENTTTKIEPSVKVTTITNSPSEVTKSIFKTRTTTRMTTTTRIISTTTSTTTTTKKSFLRTKKTYTKSDPWKKKDSFRPDHPSSHFRPSNWTNSHDFIPMPKSNLLPKEEKTPLYIVTPEGDMYTSVIETQHIPVKVINNDNQRIQNDTESVAISSGPVTENNDPKVIEDITGTTVYVIAVLAIIPVAGLLAWVVRIVIRRKELGGSESSSETGLNRPITENDSLQTTGRHSFSHPNHCFETIAEAPENIPKVEGGEMLGPGSSVWDFPRTRLRLQTVLGEGNFGKVWKAEADDICGYDGTILVAVKTVKENSSHREVEDLILEMKIMQEIGPHPNVVTILGVCTDKEPFLLIMEYVMYGKLLTHLREQRMRQSSFFNFSKDGGEAGETLTSKDLNKFAYGVAKGMEFLVSKGIIHRDLAARNILVDHNKNTKISDFGLSRNLRDLGGEMYEQKTKGALPIRWMAPESLYFSVFTPKSDVWGFGILMWEIVTLGSTPYPGMGAREVMRRVRDGYRLERPAHCHPELYLIIQKCWAGDMNKRPDFSELRKELAKLLEDQHGYIDLQNIPENKYYSMDQNPDEEEKL